jgi:hypothetical protein
MRNPIDKGKFLGEPACRFEKTVSGREQGQSLLA